MKLISGLSVFAFVAAQNKKVPPRNPEQRLGTLSEFFVKFTEEVVAPFTGDGYAGRLNTRMQGMTSSMLAAYNRPNCGYFDDSSKHGGPDPNPNVRPNGKPRNRRSTDEDNAAVVAEQCKNIKWSEMTEKLQQDCCDSDHNPDPLFSAGGECLDGKCDLACQIMEGKRSKGKGKGKKSHWDRLSNDPQTKWKQIMTGCRKWAERYIGNCGGQRKNKLITNRTKKVYEKVNTKMGW